VTAVAARVGLGYVPASDPPADPVGVRESDSRESLPAQTVSLVVPFVVCRVTAASRPYEPASAISESIDES
jgi:hypothetical protein